MSDERRNEIIELLQTADTPITGSELAQRFDISRQVIVQDIAVLRASGYNVMASSNGYFLPKKKSNNTIIKTIVSSHTGTRDMKDELMLIVGYGCKVIDVIVEHPIFGEIVAQLMIGTEEEVHQYIEKVEKHNASPLSSLTEGHHIHTIEVPSEKVYTALVDDLKKRGFIDA